MALTDALGNRVRFVLLPGQRVDTVGVPPLFEGFAFDALIADKAFNSNAIIADLDTRGAKVVISRHLRRAKPLAIDEEPAVCVSPTPAGREAEFLREPITPLGALSPNSFLKPSR